MSKDIYEGLDTNYILGQEEFKKAKTKQEVEEVCHKFWPIMDHDKDGKVTTEEYNALSEKIFDLMKVWF